MNEIPFSTPSVACLNPSVWGCMGLRLLKYTRSCHVDTPLEVSKSSSKHILNRQELTQQTIEKITLCLRKYVDVKPVGLSFVTYYAK